MSGMGIGNERASVWDDRELAGVQNGMYDVN